jgi:DNA replication protein DnaC
MTEELEQLLKNLKLRRILNIYDEQLRAAETGQLSYTEFVASLFRAQWHDRQESALEWRIRRANLPERWSLETFPWSRQPGVSARSQSSILWQSTRTSSWSGKRAWAKPDSPAGSC